MWDAKQAGWKTESDWRGARILQCTKVNGRDVKVLGNETLCRIGVELVHIIRNNVTINWTVREGVWEQS